MRGSQIGIASVLLKPSRLMSAVLMAAMLGPFGCSGTGLFSSNAGPATSNAAQVRTARPVQQHEYGIAYATDRPKARFEQPGRTDVSFDDASQPVSRRHASLIGLYGELVNQPSAGGGRFEGAGNLAQITAVTEGACFDPDVTRDGAQLVFASTQHRRTADIFLKSATGKTQRQITSDPADDVMPSIAPDNKKIAFASDRSGDWDIYITTVDGDPPVQLTSDPEPELHPSWSPDGKSIAYCKFGSQSGRWEIWVIDVEKPSAPQFLDWGIFPQWNPDPARSKIVFQRARERGSRLFSIWTIDYIGGEAIHPTEIVSAANAAVMHPAWSPDGRRIVFIAVIEPDLQQTDRPQQSDVWVVNIDGTNKTNLTNGQFLNLYPVWSSDGTVYFLSDRSGIDNIWAVATGRTIDLAVPGDSGLATAEEQ